MATKQRVDRLNSLLKEVISEVIRKEVQHPDINEFITVTRVDITKDLRHAKVYISIIGTDDKKKVAIHNTSQKKLPLFFDSLFLCLKTF